MTGESVTKILDKAKLNIFYSERLVEEAFVSKEISVAKNDANKKVVALK